MIQENCRTMFLFLLWFAPLPERGCGNVLYPNSYLLFLFWFRWLTFVLASSSGQVAETLYRASNSGWHVWRSGTEGGLVCASSAIGRKLGSGDTA